MFICFFFFLNYVHQAHLNVLQKSVNPAEVFFRQQKLCDTLAGNSCPIVTVTASPVSTTWKDMNQFREFSHLCAIVFFSLVQFFVYYFITLPHHYPPFLCDKLIHARINVKSINQSIYQSPIIHLPQISCKMCSLKPCVGKGIP